MGMLCLLSADASLLVLHQRVLLGPPCAQVRRDDVLAIQTALGGPSGSVFHQACAVALTQSIDNLTVSTPCGNGLRTGEAINQTGLNCSKVNDIAYGQYNDTA
tara:strand:+ start:436 stop:744 length:309 start_codon:yes stop_codon:yes gene_type:complete